MGILAITYKVGRDAQKSFVKASEENNSLSMLFSAMICGGAMYAFQSSARDINRLLRKHRVTLPIYDLREIRSNKTPLWYLAR